MLRSEPDTAGEAKTPILRINRPTAPSPAFKTEVKLPHVISEAQSSEEEEENVGVAVKSLLKSNALARALWSVFPQMGTGAKTAFEQQHQLPVKELPDEEVGDEHLGEGASILLSPPRPSVRAERHSATAQKPSDQRESMISAIDDGDARNGVIKTLYEALDIATDQAESLSKQTNDLHDK